MNGPEVNTPGGEWSWGEWSWGWGGGEGERSVDECIGASRPWWNSLDPRMHRSADTFSLHRLQMCGTWLDAHTVSLRGRQQTGFSIAWLLPALPSSTVKETAQDDRSKPEH